MASIPLHQTSKPSNKTHFSRWVSFEFLIDFEEMKSLLEALQPLHILSSTPIDKGNPFYVEKEQFLSAYHAYLSALKEGQIPQIASYKPFFYGFLTSHLNNIFRQKVYEDKEILVLETATILMKPICLNYSQVDHSIRVAPPNTEGMLWGLSLSFPQLIQNPKTHEIEKVTPANDLNAQVFKKIRAWIRDHTCRVTFEIADRTLTSEVRLGKNCLGWIQNHPQLPKTVKVLS